MNFVKEQSSSPVGALGRLDVSEHLHRAPLPRTRNADRNRLILVLVTTGVLFLLYVTRAGELLRYREVLYDLIRAGDLQANLTFFLISSLLIMIGTPRLIFFTLGGYAFGFGEGLLWSIGGCLAGSFMTFWAARRGSRKWLTERFGRQRFFKRIIDARPGIVAVALMRVLPVSNVAISTGLALGQANNRTFLIGSLIGFLPQGILAVLVGSGLADESSLTFTWPMSIASLLLCALFFCAARKRFR